MKDQFRSDERSAKSPRRSLSCTAHAIRSLPFAMGERMFELTKSPKHIVRFLDGGHDDLDAKGALHAVGRFLAGDLD